MLIAALCADGVTEIGNVRQIDRGYERIDERLRGARARGSRGWKTLPSPREPLRRRSAQPPPRLGRAR